jgi:hypothetical protein
VAPKSSFQEHINTPKKKKKEEEKERTVLHQSLRNKKITVLLNVQEERIVFTFIVVENSRNSDNIFLRSIAVSALAGLFRHRTALFLIHLMAITSSR